MTKKKLLLSILVVLCVVAMVASLTACKKKTGGGEETDINETNPLVIQVSELDGVFNPFFYSSAYDEDVIDMVANSLIMSDKGAALVAGDQYATIAKEYTIIPSQEPGDKSVKYEFVLKNGLKFSDGTPITADDVLFNMYVYLDPKYDGSSTMYTLPIKGLSEYRTQTTPEISAKYSEIADYIFYLGSKLGADDFATAKATPTNSYPVSYALYQAYWSYTTAAGANFAQEIVNYVLANYGSDSYVKSYLHPGLTYAELNKNYSLKVALGMTMWGFGGMVEPFSVNAEGTWAYQKATWIPYDSNNAEHKKADKYNVDTGKYTKDLEGDFVKIGEDYVAYDANNAAHQNVQRYVQAYKIAGYDDYGMPLDGAYVKGVSAGYVPYDATKHAGKIRYAASYVYETRAGEEIDLATETLTSADYWTDIKATYGEDYSDSGLNAESAGTSIDTFIKELFIAGEGSKEVAGGGIESISGITSGKKTIDGVEYETVTVECTKQNPKTILQMGIIVAPKAYYTQGYTYTEGALVCNGVEYNSAKFIAHMKTKNDKPVGSGPYVFKEYKDNVVYFERNTNFESFGLGNAKIKYVRLKVISSGQEYDAVKAGEVHYATVSATSDVVSEVSTINGLDSIMVDNLGYGYICINPKYYKNLNERVAIQTVFDLALVYEYYPTGLAEVIYRAMSKVSWAYPENCVAAYDYDATGAVAKAKFLAAGYTESPEGKLLNPAGEQATFEFTIPSNAADHPAGRIFANAKDILEDIGAIARIKVDANLIANIKKDAGVAIYALAWAATLDPDMYQVYHKDSQATSVKSNGIKYLYANGDDDTLGTIEWGNQKLNQKEALDKLADLIDEGVEYMDVADRAPIYEEALDLLAELAIEVPTYQRKNMFVFNSSVIDKSTLAAESTPYWEPLNEIWKVSLKK